MRPAPPVANTTALGRHMHHVAGFDLNGDDADHGAVLVLHQVHGEPLVQEDGAALDVGLVQRMQQGVAGAVGGGAGAGRLAALAKFFDWPPKGRW